MPVASAPILRLSAVMDVIPTSRGVDARGRQAQGRKRRTLRARVVPPTPPTVAYERTPGAGSAPLPGAYRRHEPEKTVLHGVVRDHLETFLDRARGPEGDGYPRFVEHEFRRYLDCGLLCRGFARLRCAECGYERLVAFSCKGKLCPSCLARRTADTAAWLVDRLLPEAGYRQWVLTFPFTMRFRLAADRRLLTTMLGVFLQTLFAWQRRRGRARGIGQGQTGAVTFVQRFGGAMNLNPHLHSLVPDGLFVPEPSGVNGVREAGAPGRLRFVPLPPPTTADVEELAARVAGRLTDRLAVAAEERGDYLDPDLAALVEAIFWSRNPPPGTRDLPRLPGMEASGREEDGLQGKPLCASVAGFSLHAAQSVPAHDREALERLCRYGLRAPFSQERLSRRLDGKVVYRLRRPWPHAGGATHLVLEPHDFLRRLAALVSFPYSHGVRRHGVFANRSRFRRLLPPPPPSRYAEEMELPLPGSAAPSAEGAEGTPAAMGVITSTGNAGTPAAGCPRMGSTAHRQRVSWAQLLRRVLHVDALACPRCSTATRTVPMTVLAFLSDPQVVGKILKHLGLPTMAPALAAASLSAPVLGFVLPENDAGPAEAGDGRNPDPGQPSTRPPP